MWSIPGEDEYWERRREEYENPKAFRRKSLWDDEEEPYYESGCLYLDEEVEEIEEKNGCGMSELYEDDLLDILMKQGIEAESATWDDGSCSIDYKIRVA